jgi:hypothetical protein
MNLVLQLTLFGLALADGELRLEILGSNNKFYKLNSQQLISTKIPNARTYVGHLKYLPLTQKECKIDLTQ